MSFTYSNLRMSLLCSGWQWSRGESPGMLDAIRMGVCAPSPPKKGRPRADTLQLARRATKAVIFIFVLSKVC